MNDKQRQRDAEFRDQLNTRDQQLAALRSQHQADLHALAEDCADRISVQAEQHSAQVKRLQGSLKLANGRNRDLRTEVSFCAAAV